ncbi:hypothetical protein NLI96_g10770 [Meripilus lineatus]|uniref:Integrase catalytic domain-containing protein n=1 Tax=Meripilus lineatus TaxID=2056292 RepID=A0AAD5USZ8_9APHY|nr:hypothetical protein NLI96_g10770 [Physisporinus lineatus]
MFDLAQRIKASGESLSDLIIARALLLSLPKTSAWDIIKAQIFQLDTSSFTSDNVSTKLQTEANRRAREKASGETALLATKSKRRKGGKGKGKASPDDECRYCHAKGHWISQCRKREEDEKKKNSGSSANLTVNLQDVGSRSVGQVYMARGSSAASAEIILDCGATSHMFCDRSLFTHYTPSPNSETISVGDGHPIPVAGSGIVKWESRLPNGTHTIILRNVQHIPLLATNLVSLGTLQREGATFVSVGEGISVKLRGQELFRGKLTGTSGTLYHIDRYLPGREGEGNGEVAFVTGSSGSLRLWHRRLGHINLDAIREMERKKMVTGLDITTPQKYDTVCEGCVLGKSHRLPFPSASQTTYKLMELLVTDLTGPISPPTWSGMEYAMVVVEASCRKGVGSLLVSKDQVAGELKRIVALLERQSGHKTKVIRSDSGSEFVNKTVEAFCVRNGIAQQTTNPYTPQQNGIAERAIAIYFEMVRSMLHSSGMDLRYWGEAFMYAVHIRNVSHTAALKDLVPDHAWTGRKPDISHFRIFGSVGYANIPKKLRGGKLQETSIKCRLLGWWAEETKGYRLEEVETGKLITSRDVRFVEDETPGDLALIEGGGKQPTATELTQLAPPDPEPLSPDSESPPIPVAPATSPDALSSDPIDTPAPRKRAAPGAKWEYLRGTREPSTRNRKDPTSTPTVTQSDDDSESAVESILSTSQSRAYIAFVAFYGEPSTFRQAQLSPHSKKWMEALQKEYNQLKATGTFEWVSELPKGRKAIGSRVVYREKHDGEGKIDKFKVRIVAKGFSQVPGRDFNPLFVSSSVFRTTTLRTLLSLVAHEDWEIHQVDVVGAYLQGDLDEEIYMEVPEGVEEEGKTEGTWWWKLLKALYGLKQAGRQWKKKLDEVMKEFGFTKAVADECLYVLRNKEGTITLLVLVYVDDMTIASKSRTIILNFKQDLQKHFDITDLGELHYILGIRVTRDRAARVVYLDQTAYIHTILARFGMQGCSPVLTPLVAKSQLSTSQSPSSPDEIEEYKTYANGLNYLEMVGAILYVTQTRPDIQYAVGTLAQFGSNPGKPHLEALKRVLRYLKGTAHFKLRLGGKDNTTDLVGWTDSDWAQDLDTRRSISGFTFEVAGGHVSWSSKKQPTVAHSTVEAEYMAASHATREAIWLRTLLQELGYPQVNASIIHADNQGSIALSRNPVAHSRAKHIDIRHHFIRERVANSEIDLKYCTTQQMIADVFTKPLPRETFERFRAALGVGEF